MTPLKQTLTLAFAAGLAAAATATQAQTTTNLLSQTTFDPDAPAGGVYGYYYGNNGLGTYEVTPQFYLPEDTNQTNALWRFSFDNTDLNGTLGYGTGTGGTLFRTDTDPASFASTNREDYIFSFDARVDGLDPAQTNAVGEMQVQFYYPGDSGAVKTLQVNLPFRPTAQWRHYSLNLSEGGLGDNTSEEDFAVHHAEVNDIRFNVNLHEPHTAFGYDAENVVYLDNLTLQVVSKPSAPPVPMRPVTVVDWNFDQRTADFEYNYEWSQNDTHLTRTAGNNAGGNSTNNLGVNGSSAWFLTVDTTEFANNTPQWAGAGSGGGGPVDYTQFNTNDLSVYRVTFDARVSGLAEDRTNTAAALQIFLDAPDGTLTPADENTDADPVIRLDVPISRASTNWQTYSTLLSKAGVGSGSKENFAAAVNKISAVRTQWQIENAASVADWGYDADNTLAIDNFKLERLYPESSSTKPSISATRNANNIVLNWAAPTTGTLKLQSATSVNGPYTDVTGATSGYSAPLDGKARFFRLVQVP